MIDVAALCCRPPCAEAVELVALGRCMRALDRPVDAVRMFEEALTIRPGYPPALAERAKSGVMIAFKRALGICAAVDDAEARVRS
jgi:hypothetical protein